MELAIRLTSGDKDPIRGMKTPGGRSLFSVYDAMWNTGAYPSYAAVKTAWARLTQSEFQEEVRAITTYLKFPGPGQRDTPCMDIRGLQRLIALLGGKIGVEYRRLAEMTLTRLIAGDISLAEEVQTNAASDAPISVLAREALAHPSVADGAADGAADGGGADGGAAAGKKQVNASSSSFPDVLAREAMVVDGGAGEGVIPVAYAFRVVEDEVAVLKKRKLEVEHVERMNTGMRDCIELREKVIDVDQRYNAVAEKSIEIGGRQVACIQNIRKEVGLLNNEGVEAAKSHVNLITESISHDENPTTRLLKGMGITCCLTAQMLPMEASAFRQAFLAAYQAAPPPAPVIPPAALPPAPVIPPAPVLRPAGDPAADPSGLELPPSGSLPVRPSGGQASYKPKQFPLGTIYNNIHRNQGRLPWGEFKDMAAYVARRYREKFGRPALWINNSHVYAEGELGDVQTWIEEAAEQRRLHASQKITTVFDRLG